MAAIIYLAPHYLNFQQTPGDKGKIMNVNSTYLNIQLFHFGTRKKKKLVKEVFILRF